MRRPLPSPAATLRETRHGREVAEVGKYLATQAARLRCGRRRRSCARLASAGARRRAGAEGAGRRGDEVGAWVFIRPNDDIVIRIARTEMGQGTLTGLAQLVAEELECDWKKVKTEMPTPGQNLARNRIWRDMATGGSRGIRGSQDYVRQGGAAARKMLMQAAADRGRCRPRNARPRRASSRMHHQPQDDIRQGGARRAKLRCRKTSSSRTRRTGRSSASA